MAYSERDWAYCVRFVPYTVVVVLSEVVEPVLYNWVVSGAPVVNGVDVKDGDWTPLETG